MNPIIIKIFKWIVIILLLGVVYFAFFFVIFGHTGCSTFRPIWIEGLEPECNMTLNVIRAYYNAPEKSGVVPAIEKCYSCLKWIRCQKEVFGTEPSGKLNPVVHSDTTRMNYFLNCLNRQ